MKPAPCKNCTERKQGCHGKCEKYIEWCNYREALKKENDILNETNARSFRINNIYRSIKRSGKKK